MRITWANTIGLVKGDTRSLDNSSYDVKVVVRPEGVLQ